MKTYEITKEELKGLECVAEGYKVVKYDGGTMQSYRYCEKGENLVGRIFKVDGELLACEWGLHFSKDPAYVFNFYEPLGYNRYFKVKAYGKIIDSTDGIKSVTNIIEFVEEYDIMQYIDIIQEYDRSSLRDSNAVHSSNAVRSSKAVRDSEAVSWSEAVRDSEAVRGSSAVSRSEAVSWSNAVDCSNAVRDSNAVNLSNAVYMSFGLRKCEAVSKSIFCHKKEGCKYYLFNKKTTKARYEEIYQKLIAFGWLPKFDNFYDLKGNKEWWSIAFPELMSVDNQTAWSTMPEDMKHYIQSLPEYDEKVFNKIIEND